MPAAAPMLGGLTGAITKVVCFALVCLPCIYVAQNQQRLADLEKLGSGIPPYGPLRSQPVSVDRRSPTLEVIEGQTVVWEGVKEPKGVLLTFHGCSHAATDWWDRQDSCPGCIGLPEEKRIVAAAVRRSYVVVAFSSQNSDGSRCWAAGPPPGTTPDIDRTVNSVATLAAREGWDGLPMFALGASSGGALAALLPFHLKLEGSCIQIMAVPPAAYKGAAAATPGRPFPPMLFVHMARDGATAVVAAQDVAALTAEGLTAKGVSVHPQPLSSTFFSDRIDDVDAKVSEKLFEALKQAGLLNDDRHLKDDPRRTGPKWRAALQPLVPGQELGADLGAIPEELNVAWARHEIISDTTDEMLDWFESRAATSASLR